MSDRTCSHCATTKPVVEFYRGNVCRSCHNRRMRVYRATNRDKIKELQRRCYEKNREKRLAEAKAYAEANPPDPERRRANARTHYAANKVRLKALKQVWRGNNPELVRELARRSASRRRALKRSLPVEVYTITQILDRDGTACVLCGEELDLDARWPEPLAATVEHLECLGWPDSAGDVLSNVAASHFRCNAERNIRPHPRAAAKRAELIAVPSSR